MSMFFKLLDTNESHILLFLIQYDICHGFLFGKREIQKRFTGTNGMVILTLISCCSYKVLIIVQCLMMRKTHYEEILKPIFFFFFLLEYESKVVL
ncbi:hypothetical protein ACOSQ3_003474 [Xanthoceras sorbifolium]